MTSIAEYSGKFSGIIPTTVFVCPDLDLGLKVEWPIG